MTISKRTFQSAGQLSQHLIPGAYSRIDSVRGSLGYASANNGVIMGRCTGGQPAVLYEFSNLSEAVQTLKGGDLMEACRLAFNPGDGYVPQKIYAMRVNTAVQGSTNFKDGSSNNLINIKSRDYGLSQNQVMVGLATGTNYGKKVTTKYKTMTETFDDIRQQSLTIQYTGGACTLTIVNNTGTRTFVTSAGGINIQLDAYPTIGDLVAYINAQTNFTASCIAGQESVASGRLDAVSAVSIATALTLESTMYAIIDAINLNSVFIMATDVAGAISKAIPANYTAAYLTGGTEGTYTASEWSAALTALEAENIQFISTPDPAEAVTAAIKAHCETMSSVTGKKERQYLVGGAWGDTVATAKTRGATHNSKYGLYVYNGFTQRNVDGALTNYGSSFAACMLMGMKAAMALNEPLTSKSLNVISLEKKLTNTELEGLIGNGVCPLNLNASGLPSIVRQVNTYQTDDLKWNEFSMVTCMLFASRDLREYLETLFLGKPGTAITNGVLKGAVETRLAQYKDLGIFIAGADGKAFWNVIISLSGDTVTIDYDANITAPVNFMFITNHFHELATAA